MTGPAFGYKNRPPSKPLKKAQMEGASFFTRPCAHCSHTYIAYFVSPFPPTRMYSPCCPDVHTVLLYRLISHGLVLISEWRGFALLRSEEHTSELQSRGHLVCRLLLEKRKIHVELHVHQI